jgi:type IV secretory pathway VirB2 component (pilin)
LKVKLNHERNFMKNQRYQNATRILIQSGAATTAMIIPMVAMASVESSLAAVQERLVGTLLPLAAMLGLVFAGLSFVAGHPNARSHLFYAIVGAVVGFGSESIVSFIRGLIH